MKYISFSKNEKSVELHTSSGKMCLQVCNQRVIHVQYTLKEDFSTRPSLMVLPQPEQEVPWSWEESEHVLTLSTASIRLQISKDTCAFTWMDSAGRLLVRESERDSKVLRKIELENRKAYSTRLSLAFSDGEAIYGFGQHEEGILNYRGQSQLIYHHNLKVAMPVMVSTQGYAIFFDSYSLANFHDDMYGSYFWSEVEDEMDFYFIYGPEFDEIIASLRALTGKPTLLPKWAYGYVQSKERYKTQDELIAIVKEYRHREIPIDCIVQDWLSWPGQLWGQKSFDAERFPHPDQMMEDLHELHAHLLISIWPKLRNEGPDHVEMRDAGFLLGDQTTYNAFDPQARTLYWQQANQGLFQHGIDGWWCDSTEPFEPDWFGPVKPEPWERMVTNTAVFKKYLDPEMINAYSLLHSQGMYEGQRSVTNQKRVINLTRSAYPGQHRYGTITWSGDVTARWETLRDQIPAGLNFTITGSPRWSFDIGGFFVKHNGIQWFWDGAFEKGCEDLGYRELYVRWFQLGAFLPMFRSHGTDTPREVWQFGQPGEATYDTLVKFIRLRYRLMPYIYSLAGWETHRDYTMLRALAFDFRSDPQVYDIRDQFMFGPALMVCPVTEPMYYGPDSTPLDDQPRHRKVYLPTGCDWYDFWTGKRYAGGQTLWVEAPLEIMPLFVRAGSILPLGPEIQYADEKPGAPLELRIYPGAAGSFTLYRDEGDGYAYENDQFAWTPLAWEDATRTLTTGPTSGSYPGMPERQTFKIVMVSEGHGTGVKEETPPSAEISCGSQVVAQWKH